jgi:hypothetical protein
MLICFIYNFVKGIQLVWHLKNNLNVLNVFSWNLWMYIFPNFMVSKNNSGIFWDFNNFYQIYIKIIPTIPTRKDLWKPPSPIT